MSMTNYNPVAYYNKMFKYLEQALLNKSYHMALDCLYFGAQYHKGTRKDGITPEYLHQVEQALYWLTLTSVVQYPEETICVALLHDLVEDYFEMGVRHSNIRDLTNAFVSEQVELVTNHTEMIRKPDELYYPQMTFGVIASLIKPGDWSHNLGSMAGVYTAAKIQGKIEKAHKYLFPLIKTARKRFHRQHEAYQNVKTVLIHQVRLLEHLVVATSLPESK